MCTVRLILLCSNENTCHVTTLLITPSSIPRPDSGATRVRGRGGTQVYWPPQGRAGPVHPLPVLSLKGGLCWGRGGWKWNWQCSNLRWGQSVGGVSNKALKVLLVLSWTIVFVLLKNKHYLWSKYHFKLLHFLARMVQNSFSWILYHVSTHMEDFSSIIPLCRVRLGDSSHIVHWDAWVVARKRGGY